MTPKEKAKELIDKFERATWACIMETNNGSEVLDLAKQCALIAVEEVICMVSEDDGIWITTLQYWNQVKTEIEKL